MKTLLTAPRVLAGVAAAAATIALTACDPQASGNATPVSNSPVPASATTGAPDLSSVPTPPPGRSTGRPPASTEPPPSDPTGGGRVPGPVTAVPARQVDTSGLPTYGKPPSVYLADGGRTLRIAVLPATGCASTLGVLDGQDATGVHVSLVPLDTPQGGERCSESMQQHPVLVHLAAPLGNRSVYLTARR